MESAEKVKVYVPEDFCNKFQNGQDYLDMIEEEVFSPFWKNILTALKVLW